MSARPPSPDDVVLLEGARTPIGRFLGALSRHDATQLGLAASRAALDRAGVEPEAIDAVVFGNVLQSAKDSVYLARHIGLRAGLRVEVPALVVNRACASGLDAVIEAARLLKLGEAELVLAGGAENMSQMPYAMRGVREGWRMMGAQVDDALFSALHDPEAGCSIGETVEHLAGELGIGRDRADAWAVESQRRTAAAEAAGHLAAERVPLEGVGKRAARIELDETPRPETTAEGLAALRPLYRPDGVITAGNSSGLNDAGAALVVTTRRIAEARGRAPLARLLSWAAVGVDPLRMGLGPVEACRRALARAGLGTDQLEHVELNDAFTVQAIAVVDALGLDPERVNPLGGALALGHPMGATGARMLLSAGHALRRRGGGRALCALPVGGGQGVACVLDAA
jgi:acetyl-CoA C-acetyltransferase